jgi:hypothetical protein
VKSERATPMRLTLGQKNIMAERPPMPRRSLGQPLMITEAAPTAGKIALVEAALLAVKRVSTNRCT